MNVADVATALMEKLRHGDHSFVVGNFANVDVVGHLEGENPVRQAIQAVDRHAGLVIEEAQKHGYITLVTADHGTVEKRFYPDGAIDTGHSDSPVPFMLIPPTGGENVELRSGGSLVDVSPTVLDLLGIPIPDEMTGQSLLSNSIFWMLAISFLILPLNFVPVKMKLSWKEGLILAAVYTGFMYVTFS